MSLTLYGIANCDTVKKARRWLDTHNQSYVFHDFKKQGVPEDRLTHWLQTLGWESLLKKTGTTWRSLPEDQRQGLDEDKARMLMHSQHNLITRPLLERDGQLMLAGFKEEEWMKLLG